MRPSLTLLFTSSNHWWSRVIQFFSKSRCSHVMVGLDLWGTPAVLEADVGGVQFLPRSRFFGKGDQMLVAEFAIRPEVHLRAAIEELGDRYDYVGLLGYALVMIARRLGRKIKNPLASPKAMVCSEFALALNRDGTIPAWVGLDPEATSPGDLLAICEHSASFERLPGTEMVKPVRPV